MNTTGHEEQVGASSQASSSSGADADLQIDELSYADARDYVLQFLTAEKKVEKQLQEKHTRLNTWNERLAYAEQHGTPEQLQQITRELHALIQERDALTAEKDMLHQKTIVLKEKLHLKAKDGTTQGVARAERLLADFEQLVDVDEYKLNEAIKDQEADDELAKLKAKLFNQQSS